MFFHQSFLPTYFDFHILNYENSLISINFFFFVINSKSLSISNLYLPMAIYCSLLRMGDQTYPYIFELVVYI
jgi:hypothetical protein